MLGTRIVQTENGFNNDRYQVIVVGLTPTFVSVNDLTNEEALRVAQSFENQVNKLKDVWERYAQERERRNIIGMLRRLKKYYRLNAEAVPFFELIIRRILARGKKVKHA